MNEPDMKQLFDIIFMMAVSFVMAIAVTYGLYKGAIVVWKGYKKSKMLKKIQYYVDNNQFERVISFDKEGLPVLIEIGDKKTKKIISL